MCINMLSAHVESIGEVDLQGTILLNDKSNFIMDCAIRQLYCRKLKFRHETRAFSTSIYFPAVNMSIFRINYILNASKNATFTV